MVSIRCKIIRLSTLFIWPLTFLVYGFVEVGVGTASQVFLRGGLPAFAPFAYPEKGSSDNGAVVELYRSLSRELNFPIKIEYYPYARTLEYLKTGELDMAILFKNSGLSDSVDYVGKISQSKVIVISRKGLPVLDYEDLYNLKSIAIIRTASYEARFDKDKNLKKVDVENYKQGILMLQSNRIDAVVGSLSGLQSAIDQVGADPKEWEEPFELGNKEWWVHFSNKSAHQSLIPALRKAVDKLYRANLVFELYLQQKRLSN